MALDSKTDIDKARVRAVFGEPKPINTNVFVMMRYKENEGVHIIIEEMVRKALKNKGLKPQLAKDHTFTSQLWSNVKVYMDNCRYGVAIFEDIDKNDYNPNISIELGYMFGKRKKCLILKEKTIPTLPTDIMGHIYRNFDITHIRETMTEEIDHWVRKDLGISTNVLYLHERIKQIWSDSSSRGHNMRKIIWLLHSSRAKGYEFSRIRDTTGIPSQSQTNKLLIDLESSKVIINRAGVCYLRNEVMENLLSWTKQEGK